MNDGAECGSTGVLGVCFFSCGLWIFCTYDTRPTAALFFSGYFMVFIGVFVIGWFYDIVLGRGGVQIWLCIHSVLIGPLSSLLLAFFFSGLSDDTSSEISASLSACLSWVCG